MTNETQKSFEELKCQLTSAPVLMMLDSNSHSPTYSGNSGNSGNSRWIPGGFCYDFKKLVVIPTVNNQVISDEL